METAEAIAVDLYLKWEERCRDWERPLPDDGTPVHWDELRDLEADRKRDRDFARSTCEWETWL